MASGISPGNNGEIITELLAIVSGFWIKLRRTWASAFLISGLNRKVLVGGGCDFREFRHMDRVALDRAFD